ncbi:MAG: glycosyl hydrolase [Cellulomonadaceae bacterium]
MRRRAVLGAAVLVLAGCTAGDAAVTGQTEPDVGSSVSASVWADPEPRGELPERSVAPTPSMRLADGLVPPTNRWFSGLVFGEEPQPVFPLPIGFALTGSGFTLGVATPVTSPTAIVGGMAEHVQVELGAADFVVAAYDAASVTIGAVDGSGAEVARIVIAQGSPQASVTASGDLAVTWNAEAAGGELVPPGTDESYGVVGPVGPVDGTSVDLTAGDVVTFVALPQDESAVAGVLDRAADPVVGTQLDFALDEQATTMVTYRTAQGGPTSYVRMPHHGPGAEDCAGTYPSVYGELRLCSGTSLTASAPTLTPAGTVDLSAVDDAGREELVAQVRADHAALEPRPSDTYFGGKALARDANLVLLAEALGVEEVATPLRADVGAALREWAEPDGCEQRPARCFVYDPALRGVVGLTPSFGSEEFNDHHFHYGYFLYAAGLLGADDPDLVADLAPVLNLLAADVASGSPSEEFPALRAFDAYAGHSWASGLSPFADGNNQESSSEAVNAWNGLALWASASGQTDLVAQATWLLSSEAHAAQAYWTAFDLEDPVYDGFGHLVTSLVWGAKRDYATWFSPEPAAMLGILVLPVTPVSGYLASGGPGVTPDVTGRIRENVAEAAPDGFDVMFGDYLLMYSALAGTEDASSALADARTLPDERIDDGNTRSWLLAWVHVLAAQQ